MKNSGSATRLVQFGSFELDLRSGELRNQGERIRLQEQPFRILAILLEQPGEVVTREELRERLWPADTFVDFEHGLNAAINRLRQALGDSAENPRVVETLPRKGYRFIAPLEGTFATRGASGSHRWRKPLGVVALGFVAVGVYEWSSRNHSLEPFQRIQITRLTGTGRAVDAAISQDGKSIVYVLSEAPISNPTSTGLQSLWVKNITSDSSVQIIGPAKMEFNAPTFSRDGSFIYYVASQNERRSLFEIPILGGTPTRLLDVPSAYSFSPTGKQVAFIRLLGWEQCAVAVANRDGSNEHQLAMRVVPEWFYSAVWSPDGKTLACPQSSTIPGHPERSIVTLSPNGGSEKPLTLQPWFGVFAAAWLPSGRGLIVRVMEQPGTPVQLWHVSFPEGLARRITSDLNNYEGNLSIAADGSVVTVQSDHFSNIWIAPEGRAAGAKQITVGTAGHDGYGGISWAPDGSLVYASRVSGTEDIWRMQADGTDRKQLTRRAGLNFFPRVSPDGRYVVFTSTRTGSIHIWKMRIDGSDPTQVTDGSGENHADWSPDGKWIVYSTIGPQTVRLWKIPVGGGNPVLLSDKNPVAATVSPDSTLVAFTELSSPTSVGIIPMNGRATIQELDLGIFNSRVRWTPDGKGLIYSKDEHGISNIYLQPIAGGAPRRLTDFTTDLIYSFDWSWRTRQLAVARGGESSDVVLIRDLGRSQGSGKNANSR